MIFMINKMFILSIMKILSSCLKVAYNGTRNWNNAPRPLDDSSEAEPPTS